MPRYKDRVGDQHGRLTVISVAEKQGKRVMWLCKCSCGNNKIIAGDNLGYTKSCGCYQRERTIEAHFLHGHSIRETRNREYRSWQAMRSRCLQPSCDGYKDYGGRGITICKQWDDFKVFLHDMGSRPPNTTLDRKNNDGNYEPSNCRWATPKEQANNTRRRKSRPLKKFNDIEIVSEFYTRNLHLSVRVQPVT